MRPRFLYLSTRDGQLPKGVIAGRLQRQLPDAVALREGVLFTAADCPIVAMPAVDGCIIGSLFTSDGCIPRTELTRPEQLAVLSSDGQSLIEHSSGAYLALWRGCGSAALIALRDPSACLPAYVATTGDAVVIASDVECLWETGFLDLEIDRGGIAGFLRFPQVPAERTCLIGVGELSPGIRTRFDADGIDRRAVWRPHRFAAGPEASPEDVARIIDQVVAGQQANRMRVAVELSGGLDSSIVASAIGKNGRVTAINMVPAAQDGDERRFARLVVDRYALDMREVPLGSAEIDIVARPYRLTARPTGVDHLSPLDRLLRTAQLEEDAEIVFSGAGGDSVFCYLTSTAPIIDAWRDGGWALARSTLAAIARIASVSEWEVAHHVVRRLIRARRKTWTWPANDDLLGAAGLAATPPESSQLEGLRSGKRAHMASILRSQTLFDAYERMADGDMRYPLLSQPVFEACMSIPSWRWMVGGRNRAVARDAFADRLPQAILNRVGKGRLDTLIIGAYEKAKPDIRPILLDGWLAAHDVIDTRAVEHALAAPVTGASTTHSRIMTLLDAELWCRMIQARKGEAGTG